jgi:hypothetical protein
MLVCQVGASSSSAFDRFSLGDVRIWAGMSVRPVGVSHKCYCLTPVLNQKCSEIPLAAHCMTSGAAADAGHAASRFVPEAWADGPTPAFAGVAGSRQPAIKGFLGPNFIADAAARAAPAVVNISLHGNGLPVQVNTPGLIRCVHFSQSSSGASVL